MSKDTLQQLVDGLQSIREDIARRKTELKEREQDERDVRQLILDNMEATDTDQVVGSDIYVSITNRSDVVITDRDELEAAIRERGLLDKCSRLDLDKAKRLGIKEEMPGVVREYSTSLRVVKKEKR